MAEDNEDHIKMLVTLGNLDEPPESLLINKLIRIPDTPPFRRTKES
jgi:biotin synthase